MMQRFVTFVFAQAMMKCFATGTRFDVAAALDDDDFDATTTDDDRQKKLNDLLGAITKLVNFLDQDEVCLSIAFFDSQLTTYRKGCCARETRCSCRRRAQRQLASCHRFVAVDQFSATPARAN